MRTETRVTRLVSDPAEARMLWSIYASGFSKSVDESVQDQLCYDERTLTEALADPDYAKFIFDVDGAPVGFCLATNVLEKARIAYVNPRFLERAYPQECRDGRLWYFTAIIVLPHLQNQGLFFYGITEEVTRFIEACDGLVVVDHSLETSRMMPAMLQKAARAAQSKLGLGTNDAEITVLGGQSYFALKLVSKP